MNCPKDGVAFIGRALLALLFITSGFGKAMAFQGTAGYIASKGVPLPEVCAALAVLVELGGGLAILVGWKTRLVALAFVGFLVVITVIFHPFWTITDAAQVTPQRINFMKNVSILGGFLLLYAFGPGRFSLDRK